MDIEDRLDSLCRQAAERYGVEYVKKKLIEECAELIIEMCKLPERNLMAAAEEMADVELMIHQAKRVLEIEDDVKFWRQRKLERLERLLEGGSRG